MSINNEESEETNKEPEETNGEPEETNSTESRRDFFKRITKLAAAAGIVVINGSILVDSASGTSLDCGKESRSRGRTTSIDDRDCGTQKPGGFHDASCTKADESRHRGCVRADKACSKQDPTWPVETDSACGKLRRNSEMPSHHEDGDCGLLNEMGGGSTHDDKDCNKPKGQIFDNWWKDNDCGAISNGLKDPERHHRDAACGKHAWHSDNSCGKIGNSWHRMNDRDCKQWTTADSYPDI